MRAARAVGVLGAAATALLLVGCPRSDPMSKSTPLPTKEGTIGRVNKGLEQADQDAARRREQIDKAADGK